MELSQCCGPIVGPSVGMLLVSVWSVGEQYNVCKMANSLAISTYFWGPHRLDVLLLEMPPPPHNQSCLRLKHNLLHFKTLFLFLEMIHIYN